MDEVTGAVIAIAAGLSAVFVPTAFIAGISGQFYRQFALTIAVATLISALNSLTLSPALCAILLAAARRTEGLVWPGCGIFSSVGSLERLIAALMLQARRTVARWVAASPRRIGGSRLCVADRIHSICVSNGANRLHTGPRSRLPHHRDSASGWSIAGTHR